MSLTVAAVVGAGIMLVSPAAAAENTSAATLRAAGSADEVSALAPNCYHDVNPSGTLATGGCSNVTAGWKWRLGVICDGKYAWSRWYTRATTVTARCIGGRISHAWIDKCYNGSCQTGRVSATEARLRTVTFV